MKLKPEEFKAKTAEILQNLSDQAKVSTLLTELTEHNDDAVVEITTTTATATKLTTDNETLRQANMSLFLKVGETKPADNKKPDEDTAPKFEDLFDEKGDLK
jgi:transcription-repair coupling factor (superfamily II helicase)